MSRRDAGRKFRPRAQRARLAALAAGQNLPALRREGRIPGRGHLATVLFSAWAALPAYAQTPSALYSFPHDFPQDDFGHSVAVAGDTNGDGFADLVVGAPNADYGTGQVYGKGYARVFSGSDGSILYTFRGGAFGDQMGLSVAGAGDVNLDGFADLIVSVHGAGPNGPGSGSARVYSGADGSLLFLFSGDGPGDQFGVSVSGAGDVNLDGYADLFVGACEAPPAATTGPGYARVFSGANGAVLHAFRGSATWDGFGKSVARAGDVDADGVPDLVVGAQGIYTGTPPPNGSGYVQVFSGTTGSVLHTFQGMFPDDWFGWSARGAGDANGDGHADVVVGAFQGGTGPGYARVFSGNDGSILHTFFGGALGDAFGFSVGPASDADGDGLDDILVGAPGAGHARVFSGGSGIVLYDFAGLPPFDGLGRSVAGGGDVDGDGVPDFVVGAYAGDVRVFPGTPFSCGGSVFPYGAGLAGSANLVPVLSVPGCPGLGSPLAINVANGLAGAGGALVVGLAPAAIPLFGGLLFTTPLFVLPHLLEGNPGIPGEGWRSFVFSIPNNPSLSGASPHFQAAYADPGAAQGVSFTAALAVTIG